MPTTEVRAQAFDLLNQAPCRVVLPAGAGKTELVAAMGLAAAESSQRLLVLTHTNAGVFVLRRRLSRYRVPSRAHRVATVDGWCRRLVESFPTRSNYTPTDEPDWPALHVACLRLMASPHICAMLNASYDAVVVDEYQDCSEKQREVLDAIAELLPMVVLGDPLQALYSFGGERSIDWDTDLPHLPEVAITSTPWRWREHNPQLGEDLTAVRSKLLAGSQIDLHEYPSITWSMDVPEERRNAGWSVLKRAGSAVLLERWPETCVDLARGFKGNFGVMEELEGKRLLKVAEQVDAGGGVAAAAAVIKLATDCHTGLSQLKEKGKAMSDGSFPTFRSNNRAAPALEPLRAFAEAPSPARLSAALDGIEALGGTRFGYEAWGDLRRAVKAWAEGAPTLVTAVRSVRDRRRGGGRGTLGRSISRTILVKGLEFDHCVVTSAHELSRCELYVAMTRGRSSLTVLSDEPILSPD